MEALALGHCAVILLAHGAWMAADPCIRSSKAPARCADCGKRRVRISLASLASVAADAAALGLVLGAAFAVALARDRYGFAKEMRSALWRYLAAYVACRVVFDCLKTLFEYRPYIALVARDAAVREAVTGAKCDDPDAAAGTKQSKCYGTALPAGAAVATDDLRLSAPAFRCWMAIWMRETAVAAALFALVSVVYRVMKAQR
jgi:hypothetical protein